MTRRSFCAVLVPVAATSLTGPGAEGSGTPADRDRATDRVELAGRWILTMPSGPQWNATFERNGLSDHVYLQCGALLLRGEYELRGRSLSVVRPWDEKMVGLVWRVRNKNLLELVEHPVSSQFGSDYRGAVLVRRIDEERARGNEG